MAKSDYENLRWYNLNHLLALGFGSGLAPKAPGTFGTLAAIPFFLLLSGLSPTSYAVLVLFSFIVGVWVCHKTSEDMGSHDHGSIVWDEFVGFWITMFMVPVSVASVVLGFALFRLFDVWKPWPIALIDRKVGGGFGIMIDDVIAGVFAAISLQLILRLPYFS